MQLLHQLYLQTGFQTGSCFLLFDEVPAVTMPGHVTIFRYGPLTAEPMRGPVVGPDVQAGELPYPFNLVIAPGSRRTRTLLFKFGLGGESRGSAEK